MSQLFPRHEAQLPTPHSEMISPRGKDEDLGYFLFPIPRGSMSCKERQSKQAVKLEILGQIRMLYSRNEEKQTENGDRDSLTVSDAIALAFIQGCPSLQGSLSREGGSAGGAAPIHDGNR
jgi:hypothetical protein